MNYKAAKEVLDFLEKNKIECEIKFDVGGFNLIFSDKNYDIFQNMINHQPFKNFFINDIEIKPKSNYNFYQCFFQDIKIYWWDTIRINSVDNEGIFCELPGMYGKGQDIYVFWDEDREIIDIHAHDNFNKNLLYDFFIDYTECL